MINFIVQDGDGCQEKWLLLCELSCGNLGFGIGHNCLCCYFCFFVFPSFRNVLPMTIIWLFSASCVAPLIIEKKIQLEPIWAFVGHNIQPLAAIAPWFRLRLPSCCPGFESQAYHLCFFNLYWNCNEKRTEIKQKEAGIGPFFKKTFSQIIIDYFVRGSITVWLTSCLTGLDKVLFLPISWSTTYLLVWLN